MVKGKEPRYFILIGDPGTWTTSLLYSRWGFSERSKGSWNTSDVGDYLAFYVTSPIKKVIGFGRISRRYVDDSLVFPDERLFGKAIWMFRLEFVKIYVTEDWEAGVTLPPHLILNVGRKVIDKSLFLQLVRKVEQKWNQNMKQIN
jgi:hypothetical protein